MSKTKKTTNRMLTKVSTLVKRGRPIVAGSKRQAVLAIRDAKRAQGLEIKRGRPRKQIMINVDVVSKTPKQATLANVNEA